MSFDCEFKVGSRIGFLGVGTMNSAIIEGILNLPISKDCVSDNFSVPIFVSPRGSMKVASLLKKHGNTKIHVCKDNQDLLDKSDVVFIGVRPEQVDKYVMNQYELLKIKLHIQFKYTKNVLYFLNPLR